MWELVQDSRLQVADPMLTCSNDCYLHFSSSTRRRFHPHLVSGKAMVTVISPPAPLPLCMPSFFSRIPGQGSAHTHWSSIFIACLLFIPPIGVDFSPKHFRSAFLNRFGGRVAFLPKKSFRVSQKKKSGGGAFCMCAFVMLMNVEQKKNRKLCRRLAFYPSTTSRV